MASVLLHSNVPESSRRGPEDRGILAPLSARVPNIQAEYHVPLQHKKVVVVRGGQENEPTAADFADMERDRKAAAKEAQTRGLRQFREKIALRVKEQSIVQHKTAQQRMQQLAERELSLKVRTHDSTSGSSSRAEEGSAATADSTLILDHLLNASGAPVERSLARLPAGQLARLEHTALLAATRRHEMDTERRRIREEAERLQREQEAARAAARRQLEEQRRAAEALAQQAALEQAEREERAAQQAQALQEQTMLLQRAAQRERRQIESSRYNDALRERFVERVRAAEAELPPLCSCGHSLLDRAYVDKCASNCELYRNPSRYAAALVNMLLACGVLSLDDEAGA